MAKASGLALVGGPDGNDPVRAGTGVTGQLIAAAVLAGARRIVVGMGGSATTDGGLAALTVLEPHSRLLGVELLVACDVTTPFLDAAAVFAPQKGATPAQVGLAWLLAHASETMLIPGTRSVAHLEENLAAGDVVLDAETMATLGA